MIKLSKTIVAYQNNNQHGSNKCPDGIRSIPRRQPATGLEMKEKTEKLPSQLKQLSATMEIPKVCGTL